MDKQIMWLEPHLEPGECFHEVITFATPAKVMESWRGSLAKQIRWRVICLENCGV